MSNDLAQYSDQFILSQVEYYRSLGGGYRDHNTHRIEGNRRMYEAEARLRKLI